MTTTYCPPLGEPTTAPRVTPIEKEQSLSNNEARVASACLGHLNINIRYSHGAYRATLPPQSAFPSGYTAEDVNFTNLVARVMWEESRLKHLEAA